MKMQINEIYEVLVAGTREYVKKSGFSKVVMGLSGGIDSAVVCVLAKDAFGAENVLTLAMPSRYSSKASETYARRIAGNIDVKIKTLDISDVYDSYERTLKPFLETKKNNDVEIYLQNIQARIRGNILMAFSNKLEHMVLATGNKSELLTGYCTLYGDMTGGIAPLADVTKTMVYELADYINRKDEIVPREIIERVPTAELSPNQTDQDALPPYGILDEIICCLEGGCSAEDISRKGFDIETINWVKERVEKNRYKRKQAPSGIKITTQLPTS
ncbi:MAG: NAD(+) synthase [Candidatus Omnitrophica bacterium]|nr:NAD(+) synthase [Candidatus Omnitrophota bacterium]